MVFTSEELEKITQFKASGAEAVPVPEEADSITQGLARFEKFQKFVETKEEPTQFERVQRIGQREEESQRTINSIGNLLGIEPGQVKTGSPEFKEALAARIPEEPTIRGAIIETGKTFLEAAKNIPKSGFELVKEVASAIASPIDTAKSLGGLVVGLVQKLIPGEQEQEKFVDALVDNYAERFGSLEKARETFVTDPIGFLADTAGVIIGGGAVIKGAGKLAKLEKLVAAGEVIKGAGVAIDPLLTVAKAGGAAGKALTKSAERDIERVLAPTKQVTKAKARKVISALTQEKIKAFSTEGFQKQIRSKLDDIGKEFDSFLEAEGVQGTTKIKILTDLLESAKDQFKVGDVIAAPKSVKIIEDLQRLVSQFGDEIPNSDLRNLRQIFDKSIAQGRRFDIAKTSAVLDELDFKKMLADSIREELARSNPKLDVINKKFTFYKNVDDVLSETLKRRTGQSGGLGRKLGFIAGLATGEGVIGKLVNATALSTLIKTMESAVWRTVSADLKLRLAKSLSEGNKAAIADVLRQIEKTKEEEG